MDWDAIRATGEIIGAIAVLVTIVYLASQVRASKSSTDSSTFVSIVGGLNEANTLLATDPDMAALIERGMRDPADLTPEEENRFFYYVRTVMNLFWTMFVMHHHGKLSTEMWSPWDAVLRNYLNVPGVRRFVETQFHIDKPELASFAEYCHSAWQNDAWDGTSFVSTR